MLFEKGVSYYTKIPVHIIISFPENMTFCQWCRFCRNEDSLKRWKCLLTDEYLAKPFTSIGVDCPIWQVKESEGNDG